MLRPWGSRGLRRTWASTSASLYPPILPRRRGSQLGRAWKVKHLETRTLWAQDKIDEGVVVVKKVGGDRNVADILTKYLSSPRLRSLLAELPSRRVGGEALIGATAAGKIGTLNS